MTDDHRDDTGRRPKLWPLSGPVTIDPDEITDRHSALSESPAVQAAFTRLQRQREEDRRAIETAIAALAKEMRDRDHGVRNAMTERIESLAEEVRDHHAEDVKAFTDLVGQSGGGPGRVGALEGWRASAGKLFGLAASAAIGSLVTAVLAWRSAAYETGRKDAAIQQLGEVVRENRAAIAVMRAVLYASGLLKVSDGAMSLPSMSTDSGDTP